MTSETIRHIKDVSPGIWGDQTFESITKFPKEFADPVDMECITPGCSIHYTCERAMASFCAHCPDCCDTNVLDNLLEQIDHHWRFICPKNLRLTDPEHPDFPAHVWAKHQGYVGEESMFLFGPTRAGKTRLGVLMVKAALLAKKSATMVWPEELTEYAKGRDRLHQIQRIGRHDVMLLDDALLTGAQDERVSSFLKDLIDFAMRNDKRVIITSQIGGEDYADQADKFGNLTQTDRKRIDALIARLREECTVVKVVKAADLPPPVTKEMF